MYPGGAPIIRATECFSMYSDMSRRIIARSSSNRNSASARAVSVFPTPVGPRKMKGAGGTVGVLEPGPAPPHRVGHGGHRFPLPDPPPAQLRLEAGEPLPGRFGHLGHRDPR